MTRIVFVIACVQMLTSVSGTATANSVFDTVFNADQAQAIAETGDWLYHVHCCENDRGTPGSGLVDWDDVFKALKQINYDRWLVIESFTPDVKEIAKATAIWRQIAPSAEALAIDGLAFLREMADQYLSD